MMQKVKSLFKGRAATAAATFMATMDLVLPYPQKGSSRDCEIQINDECMFPSSTCGKGFKHHFLNKAMPGLDSLISTYLEISEVS